MALPSNDPRPPYQLAADKLREEITSGRLKPGDRLPSSRDLRETLGIANATVHSALRVLRDEGLIYSVAGRGSYVSDPQPSPGGAEATPPEEDRVSSAQFRQLKQRLDELEERLDRVLALVESVNEDHPRETKG
ncbi:GntR family transcriptional regulator [Streptomyces marincola]|uniref:GntR family transcriptional regulator n=1 Tax=Streptomyces marincola TaxID=2878388 RepID=UPI001CF4ADE9|nr:winged helix-turn-helix domain-containing protein [Streptomyces marincola]UCM89273.1 winged helix-turn-helix domain-containing protein [Streptomyces marincola]